MQVVAEALGLALSRRALVPPTMAEIRRAVRAAGQQVMALLRTAIAAHAAIDNHQREASCSNA